MHVELREKATVQVVGLDGEFVVEKLKLTHVVVSNGAQTYEIERHRITVAHKRPPEPVELLSIDELPDQETYAVYKAFNSGKITAEEGARRIGEIEARERAARNGRILSDSDIAAARIPKATFYNRAAKVRELGGVKGLQRRPHGAKGGSYFSPETRQHAKNRATDWKKGDKKKVLVRTIQEELTLYHTQNPEKHPKVPSYETLRNWLQADLKALRKARSTAGHYYDVPDTLLHTVQIDHCLLNIELLDDGVNVGRPWLTLAIDVASRVIFGFYLTFRDPSAVSISATVTMCVLPKMSKGEFWPYGVMLFLHADNGPDLRSNALELGCQHWNIDIDWRPTATPEYGAFIESLIGKVKDWVLELPGACVFDEAKRKRSLSKPKLSIQDLRAWLTGRIQNVYHTTSHSGIGGLTPLQAYETLLIGTDERPGLGVVKQIPPERADEFRISFLPAYDPTLTGQGVVIDYLWYNAPALQAMLKRIGAGNEVWVRRNHDDISVAYVWDPEAEIYIKVKSRLKQKLSNKVWQRAKDLLDAKQIEKDSDSILAQAIQLAQQEAHGHGKTHPTRSQHRQKAHEKDVAPLREASPKFDVEKIKPAGAEIDWDDDA